MSINERLHKLLDELELLKSVKVELTDSEAIDVLRISILSFEDAANNKFLVDISKLDVNKMSNKQIAWLHILANKYVKRIINNENVRYRKKYKFSDVELCAKLNGYFVRKRYSMQSNIVKIDVSSNDKFEEYISFDSTTETIEFMTGWKLTNHNSIFAKK